MTYVKNRRTTIEELPADNVARIAIYDALSAAAAAGGSGQHALTDDELFARVIPRLRILVPRELHLFGEHAYVDQKIAACIESGIVQRVEGRPKGITLGSAVPRIRYPDGSVRDYEAHLEAARERLEADDAKLRHRGFDVRRLVPSLASRQKSERFRALVDSMREHGYLKHYPVLEGADGEVVDGRARKAAAAISGVGPVAERLPQRRDTPLHRVLLLLDLNRGRLTEDDVVRVYSEVEKYTGRSWRDISQDLALTRAWRRATPKQYSRSVEVKKVPYREGGRPQVQMTRDGKVMMRSLIEAAGLAAYKFDHQLSGYVLSEQAKTKFSAGKPATFVGIDDAIEGIAAMQRDRKKSGRSVEKAWDDIRKWLIAHRSSKAHENEGFDIAGAADVSVAAASEPQAV